LELAGERPFSASAEQRFLIRYTVSRVRKQVTPRLGRPLRTSQLPAEKLLGVVHDNRFSKLSEGRARGEEDPHHHFRNGKPGTGAITFCRALKACSRKDIGDCS
jgi:hypothetical protein